jgi:hypothetical protein
MNTEWFIRITEPTHQQETTMKKLLIAAATFASLTTGAFADQNLENENRMAELRKMFFEMTAQMIDDEIQTTQMHTKRLTAYQRFLQQMMENEHIGHANK